VALKDCVQREHPCNGARNASYLSAEMQNALFSCTGTAMFAIAADETIDCYESEQLVMTVCYVLSSIDV